MTAVFFNRRYGSFLIAAIKKKRGFGGWGRDFLLLKGKSKYFTRVNIENSGYILYFGWGFWAVLPGVRLKARIGVGNKMPVSGYNTHAPSP
jgi:hypothetical protein